MLKIYLTRHGQDEDNAGGLLNGHRDKPLTSLGLQQAQALAAFVKEQGISFAAIYSSPLRRAYQTAETISVALAADKPIILPLLIERDFGIMTGEKISDIEKLSSSELFKTATVNYLLDGEGVETFPDLKTRAEKILNFIEANHKDGNILLVCHGDLGKMIYAAYYGLPWEEALAGFHFGNTELILLDPENKDTKIIFNTLQFNS